MNYAPQPVDSNKYFIVMASMEQDGVLAAKSFAMMDLKCDICEFLWIVDYESPKRSLQNYKTGKYCKNCFEFVEISIKRNNVPIDPYDMRSWCRCKLPIRLFHCCSCGTVYEKHLLSLYVDGLIEQQVYIPHSVHRYCITCFQDRVSNPKEGFSPYGCCYK